MVSMMKNDPRATLVDIDDSSVERTYTRGEIYAIPHGFCHTCAGRARRVTDHQTSATLPRSRGVDAATTAEWHTPFAMDVVWLSTHSHKHTTGVDVEVLRAGALAQPLLHTASYNHPAFDYYPPPTLHLDAGDSFRWTCRYRNDASTPLQFGVTAEDEMCFTVGFFVTPEEGPLPAVPGCFGRGLGLVCPTN